MSPETWTAGKKFKLELPVGLTPEQIAKLADALAKKEVLLAKLKQEKKDAVAKYGAEIKLIEQDIATLAHDVTHATQHRLVEVVIEKNYKAKKIRHRRVDTHEILPDSERDMVPAETQSALDEVAASGKGKTSKASKKKAASKKKTSKRKATGKRTKASASSGKS